MKNLTKDKICAGILLGIAALAAVTDSDAACDDRLVVGTVLGSKHWSNSPDGLNESQQPSAYINCNNWVAGTYRNSFDRQSVFGGYEFMFGSAGPVEFSAYAGAISNYPEDWSINDDKYDDDSSGSKIIPWGSLNARLTVHKNIQPVIYVVPTVVTAVGIEWRFW